MTPGPYTPQVGEQPDDSAIYLLTQRLELAAAHLSLQVVLVSSEL